MTALAGKALLKLPNFGKSEALTQANGGFTCLKGPSHPLEGQGVNCPPLGLVGQWSSTGGEADFPGQRYCVHTVKLKQIQLYIVYKSLVVQSTNCETLLDNLY